MQPSAIIGYSLMAGISLFLLFSSQDSLSAFFGGIGFGYAAFQLISANWEE
jgi:hypothetical protein